jgi:hypothetical protein
MRLLPLFALLPFAIPALGAFQEGQFGYAHDVAFLGYANEEACKTDEGRWEDGICVMEGEDTVAVAKKGAEWSVEINTVTTNAHTCDFSGKAKLVSERELVASTRTEEYVPGKNGSEGKFIPAVCRLKVTYTSTDTVYVNVLGRPATCATLCGANAMLQIEGAKRK